MSKSEKNIFKEVEKALDEVRPFLKADGGGVELVDIVDNVVKVRLTGSCSDCNISMQTLKNGIETSIKNTIPLITKVIAIN